MLVPDLCRCAPLLFPLLFSCCAGTSAAPGAKKQGSEFNSDPCFFRVKTQRRGPGTSQGRDRCDYPKTPCVVTSPQCLKFYRGRGVGRTAH